MSVDEDHDETAVEQQDSEVQQSQKKRRKIQPQTTVYTSTLRRPTWAYLSLTYLASSRSLSTTAPDTDDDPVDAITLQLALQSAMQQFLGLHGTAITMDILKLDENNIWIRVPSEDLSTVVAGLSGWMGRNGEALRIKDYGHWSPKTFDGQDLFG